MPDPQQLLLFIAAVPDLGAVAAFMFVGFGLKLALSDNPICH